jgi:hypothetical protein
MNEAPLDQLQVSLERAISGWMDVKAAEDGPWSAVGYVGDNTSRLMACAAMSIPSPFLWRLLNQILTLKILIKVRRGPQYGHRCTGHES